MEAVAEPPAYRFNKQNAREMALKSHAPDSARHVRKHDDADLTEDEREELKIVEEQIARARKDLNDEKCYCPACERGPLFGSGRAQMIKALDQLLDRRRILLRRPMLSAVKVPVSKRHSSPPSDPTPV